ncbi:MAG: circularly permuted type 2 ATP-grasp protein [Caldilineaceae bacterium]
MATPSGEVHPHWRDFNAYLARLGARGAAQQQQDVRRLLQENGVTYNVHGAPDGHQRPWPLDIVPLILAEDDWRTIEAGVTQRAELLNQIYADLYGPQTLIKKGLLPLELIYRDAGFLRPCHNALPPTDRPLIIYAADLARGPDRRLWVVGDRTQAPSGAGYALENRTIVAQLQSSLFRDNQIRRLAGFFRELQSTLARLSPQHQEAPRVVVMTPGPHNETYFEHAYLAAYLGYTLVQGDDLSVHQGDVSLKALSGLQPVDVIMRRVDDTFCDPLELRADSWLGVAGLLEAVRRRRAAVVNPLGSGVLENPGLMPFLPNVARHLLGEELILPMAATWWCGQPKERDFVLANLEKLIIRRCGGGYWQPILGAQLSQKELAALRTQIQARPYDYVGQEQVAYSTAPALVNGRLEPRHTVLRTYAVARKDDYTVMPGGLTRTAPAPNELMVSTSAGGASKDTWILTAEPQHYISLWQNRADLSIEALHTTESLPSRAAENLFWVGRYAERAEATARLLRTIFDFFIGDEAPTHPVEQAVLQQLLIALTQVTMTYPGFVDEGAKARLRRPYPELLAVTLDAQKMGALHADLKSMVNTAYAVRNLWSTDSWRVMQEVDRLWEELQQQMLGKRKRFDLSLLRRELNQLITQMMALAGLNAESMTHNAGWRLLDAGRRLERAIRTIALIRAVLAVVHEPVVEQLLLEATLKTTENIITYRRRYRANLQVRTVLDLLMHDDRNPRSLIWQLNQLQEHLSHLPRARADYKLSAEEQIILQASTQLQLANSDQLTAQHEETVVRQQLEDLMADLSFQLSELSNVLTRTFFTHVQIPQQYGAARAEMAPRLA